MLKILFIISFGVVLPNKESRASIASRNSKDKSSSSRFLDFIKTEARDKEFLQDKIARFCLGVDRYTESECIGTSLRVFFMAEIKVFKPCFCLQEICITGFDVLVFA